MGRSTRKSRMIVSALSDEQLAVILANDYNRAPEEFIPSRSVDTLNGKEFLVNTSARGIVPMKKWL